MLAWMVFEFFALLFVAGQTWSDQIVGQCQLHWSMRVGMTGEAFGQIIMRFAFMAVCTRRNGLGSLRRMLLVAVQTCDVGLMQAAFLLYSNRFTGMAFDTV